MYERVNAQIYDLFLQKSEGSEYFIMSFDQTDFLRISKTNGLKDEELIDVILQDNRRSWANYLKSIDDIPQCFGIVALQIFCASLMGSPGYSDNEYNPILLKILGVSENFLQLYLYKEHQDEIWQLLKNYIKSIGYKPNIPSRKSYKGCYIQYPLSQVYLNENDLSRLYNYYFDKELKADQVVKFEDFIDILKIRNAFSYIPSKYRTSHLNSVLLRRDFSLKIAQRQLYNSFLKWNGETTNEHYIASASKPKLYFEDKPDTFYILTPEMETINLSKFRHNLVEKNIISVNTDFMLLQSSLLLYAHEEVKKVEENENILIIVFNNNHVINKFLADLKFTPDLILERCSIFKIKTDSNVVNSSLGSLILSKNRGRYIELRKGYRLHRNKFLFQYGPQFQLLDRLLITIDYKTKYYFKNEHLDLENLPIGLHKITIADVGTFHLEIVNPMILERIKIPQDGWNLNEYSPNDQNFHLNGLYTRLLFNENNVKTFLDVTIGKKKIQSKNQILNALSRLN